MQQCMITHIQTWVQSDEDHVFLVNAQWDIHKSLAVQQVCLSISNKKYTLEFLHSCGCCNIVGGLALALWK